MEPFTRPEPDTGCPEWGTLVDFNSGRLPEPHLEAVAVHLAHCPTCGMMIKDLDGLSSDDSFTARVQRCLEAPPFSEDSGFRVMEAGALVLAGAAAADRPGAGGEQVNPDTPPELPLSIGPYLILARVGQGGMGVVFRALQRPVNRLVAVKMLRAGAHAGPEAVVRFQTEGAAVARLRHPNVVQFYDFGRHGGLPYSVMEWVEGGSLAERLAVGPISARQAAEIVRAVATAVDYAHGKQVVHRDLKPSNVLLAADGAPKVTDFGLAKLLDEDDGLTSHDAVLGTASYMSPEQAEGRQAEVGPLSDVYALGAILYEALTGRPPFTGRTKVETLRLVREGTLVTPSRVKPGVPEDLEGICLRCLERPPRRRYPSAAALAEDLGRWLSGERPRGVRGRLARVARAVIARPRGALCGIALLTAGLVWSLRDSDRPVERLAGELARDLPVTLIKVSGKPAWYRWLAGGEGGQTSLAPDGAFQVHAPHLGLVELLPTVPAGAYRFAAAVRHEKSNKPGEAGLFFAKAAHPGGKEEIHFFLQLTFDDVRPKQEVPIVLPTGRRPPRPGNVANLLAHLYASGRTPDIDWRMASRPGPEFAPSGEGLSTWRDLEVTVASDGVTARWDGHLIRMSAPEVRDAVQAAMAEFRPRYRSDPFAVNLKPEYAPRGGLGLYLFRGTASFRSVTVTPLSSDNWAIRD